MEFLRELLAVLQPEQAETTFNLAHPSAGVKLHSNEQPSRGTTDCNYESFETEVRAMGTMDRDSQIMTSPFFCHSPP